MKYYISADGGGTKLEAILYDEDFNIISTSRVGGTNHNFRSLEDIKADAERLAAELIPDSIKEIEGADISIVGDSKILIDALAARAKINDVRSIHEMENTFASACEKYGVAAQAGTGSDAFLIQPNSRLAVGGWGATLGDEGSGYDIGVKTIKAAIYAEDGRGPYTEILPILKREWELNVLWDVIDRITSSKDKRRLIASATRIAAMAAELGDTVAKSIFENAAEELAHQVRTVIRNNGGKFDGPIIASGGAWRASPIMFDYFKRIIGESYPDAKVIRSIFSPVIGTAFIRHSEKYEDTEVLKSIFKKKFKDYLI